MAVLSENRSSITLNHLVALHKLMLDNHDLKNAEKILELYKKLDKHEFIIGFTGHFSAGKSSMIDALLGKEILPKGPIPTSANIVKITSGGGFARVFFKQDDPIEYKEPYDLAMIQEYCKDKDSIHRIELSTSDPVVPPGCAIIDTPGIDAADDADRIITESSLHLVDLLFYVMDYNHVQSEVNLQFLSHLQARKIPFYIIINQVDKHDELEISFQSFHESVKQTFDQWGIFPKQIFYSSLIDRKAKHNQFAEIKNMLSALFKSEQGQMLYIDHSTTQIVKDHKKFLQHMTEEKLAGLSVNQDSTMVDPDKLLIINQQISKLEQEPTDIEKAFSLDLNHTLKNAYIMPAELRDKATAFLVSQQKDFKVGFIGSKKKTEEEKITRLHAFLHALQKNMEAAIQWKLRDKFFHLLQKHEILDHDLVKEVQQLAVVYTGDDLLGITKVGATINGDYVINYTNNVSADVKSKYRRVAQQLWGRLQLAIELKTSNQLKDLEKQRDQMLRKREERQQFDSIQSSLKQLMEHLDSQLTHPEVSEEALHELKRREEIIFRPAPTAYMQPSKMKVKSDAVVNKDENSLVVNQQHPIHKIVRHIENTIETVKNVPGFQALIESLRDKRNRLDNREITVALFGAFSAGKSSFANALIGENILPTSPNPTTAVINRILPITADYKHGTVVVQMKDKETLVNDIVSITKHLQPNTVIFSDLIAWVKENRIDENIELNKMFQTFLTALVNGYPQNVNRIGGEIVITLEEFAGFVTDETKACYIEAIDLYYDCALTRQGITLVDTPGADSVNSRHTNVAFNYIKYADAILYVTYYNHAFSQADKDFLMQLGRVKEVFELDKMFFIINAADLARNKMELNEVVHYVEEQLLQFGIRFPKIFPISSKQSLVEKLKAQLLNDRMMTFEKAFYQFINHDLASLMVDSALFEMNRVRQSLANYINNLQLNEQEKETFRRQLLTEQEQMEAVINTSDLSTFVARISQKIEKQLHYVTERLSIRFHDLYKDKFNPTTINEPGKGATVQLQRCLRDLIDYVGYELLQEVRAVSLRVESFIRKEVLHINQEIDQKLRLINQAFILSEQTDFQLDTPKYEQAFILMDLQIFNKLLSRYKGTKAFFVKNEKDIMKENIYAILFPYIKDYLQEINQQMTTSYMVQWEEVIYRRKSRVIHEIDDYLENNLSMMSETIDTQTLMEKNVILDSLYSALTEKDEIN